MKAVFTGKPVPRKEFFDEVGKKLKEVLEIDTKKNCPKCGYVNRKGKKLLNELKYDRTCDYCHFSWVTLN